MGRVLRASYKSPSHIMPFSHQYGHQLADKMVLHEFDLTSELNTASDVRSNSCSAIDYKNPCISTIRSKSEVPCGRKLYGSTKDDVLGIALKKPICQHVDDRKQKPLEDSQEVQDLSSDDPGRPDSLRVPREESPPPEIISVRKVQHSRPTKPIYAISKYEHKTTSSPLQHPPPPHQHDRHPTHRQHSPPTHNMGNKRQQTQTERNEKKRQKITASNSSPARDLNVSELNLFTLYSLIS